MKPELLQQQVGEMSHKQLTYIVYQIVNRQYGGGAETLTLPEIFVKNSEIDYEKIRESLSAWMLDDIENERDVQLWISEFNADENQVDFAGQSPKGSVNMALLYSFQEYLQHALKLKNLSILKTTNPELQQIAKEKSNPKELDEYPRQQIDLLIFSAIEEEDRELRKRCKRICWENNPFYKASYFKGSYNGLTVVLHRTGQGNPRSAAEVANALAFYRPKLAIFVGIAGGVKKVAFSDIIIPNRVDYVESGKDGPQGHQHRAQSETTDLQMQNWIRQYKDEVHDQIPSFLKKFQIHEQPIASGEEVATASNGEVLRRIRQHMESTVAYEMEGFGFVMAVHKGEINYLIVRGISDLIEDKDQTYHSGSREKAAKTAVTFTFDFIGFLQKKNFFTSNQ